MINEDPNNLAKEIKPILKEVRESLPVIKTIILAPLAFGYALGEEYLNKIAKRQAEAKKQSKILAQQKRTEEREKRLEERKADEIAKIAAEKRAEEREKSIREESRKMTPMKCFTALISASSALALVVGVTRLAPIATWTNNVNQCVKESSENNISEKSFSEIFKSCNRSQ
ncbi:hypothetical protein [Prochlorococcus marinus]|uniref:Uncharacterized protein n=1 Tax=Prochlorococcus marinus (strain MIT 9211) TaxID=93059 RepID=A9BBA6_PROM4|nr:hypothetical protein [Prochlorococcus marinus]ABX09118.1 Hypothetical protein P9211_11871 [Prochlorococcus marinus str. MIT 9211]